VNFRTTKESYKDKRLTRNPKESWVIFENTHEAIVEQGMWETAQRCQSVKRRTDATGEPTPLTGLLYCADCGKRLYNHRRRAQKKLDKRTGRYYNQSAQSMYTCPTYGNSVSRGEDTDCTIHYISTKTANNLILEAIRRTTAFARDNEVEFIRILREATEIKQAATAKSHKRQIAKNEKRITELDALFRKTYEDYAAGVLIQKRFEQLSQDYEAEQTELEVRTEEIKSELAQFEGDTIRADKFMELARRYTDFTELTPAMLHEFVDRVIVFEADRSNGVREQIVDVYLNYIGKFEIPSEPEIIDVEAEEQRAQWREYKRQERAKKKTA